MRHDPRGKCPVTGEAIPEGFVWTDHKKEGSFNSCYACNKKIPQTLQELNDKREREGEHE